MKIGVISDTHGYLDPRIETIFKGVTHILHAGDIGQPVIILELELIAPVTAVLGNTDDDVGYGLTQVIEVGGKKFLLHHIVNPAGLSEVMKKSIAKIRPDVVVFGHTHKKFADYRGETFFFNPGYAGKPKFGAERSVGILHLEHGVLNHEFIQL